MHPTIDKKDQCAKLFDVSHCKPIYYIPALIQHNTTEHGNSLKPKAKPEVCVPQRACGRYKLDDRTVTSMRSAMSLVSAPGTAGKYFRKDIFLQALCPTTGHFSTRPESISRSAVRNLRQWNRSCYFRRGSTATHGPSGPAERV